MKFRLQVHLIMDGDRIKVMESHLVSLLPTAAKDLLNLPVFPTGKHHLTLWEVIYLLILLALLFIATRLTKKWLIEKILVKTSLDPGVRYALGTIFSYMLLTVGLLVILDTAGVDVTIITVIAGALGIGISLSLQNIITNLFAGLIILIERPIKVGDYVQVGDTVGEVTEISLRATTVVTPQNTAVIVPNSEFISSRVINLSFRGSAVRLTIPITIETDEDPEKLVQLLTTVSEQEPGILTSRQNQVLLDSFSKENRTFKLLVWTQVYAFQPEALKSNLNRAISKALFGQSPKAPEKPEQAESANVPGARESSLSPPSKR
jgi:small-conductance mechanosensitive channel